MHLCCATPATANTSPVVGTLRPTGGVTSTRAARRLRHAGRGRAASHPAVLLYRRRHVRGNSSRHAQLMDGSTDLGTVALAFTLGAFGPGQKGTFQNTTPITVPVTASALPYPSTIAVSGLYGTDRQGDGDPQRSQSHLSGRRRRAAGRSGGQSVVRMSVRRRPGGTRPASPSPSTMPPRCPSRRQPPRLGHLPARELRERADPFSSPAPAGRIGRAFRLQRPIRTAPGASSTRTTSRPWMAGASPPAGA